ncbi:MAG: site-2 protease family protein [Acidobacteriota bacterium]|nr:MAG: site-2 protease family protein [Acidobacteriota bacterium]
MPFDIVGLALWLVAFVLSATCHEAAHALVARWGGDPTAYQAGQVTLNPLPHMRREPFGMIVVPLVCYAMAGWMIGWASAPYDPLWAHRHPRRAGLMAAAGPVANFLLAALAIVAIRLLVVAGVGAPPEEATFERLVTPLASDALVVALTRFLSILALLNALLGVFNLVPLPPLDGSAVLEGFGGAGVVRVMDAIRSMPFAGLIGLLVAWRIFDHVAPYVWVGVLHLVHPGLY